MKIKFYLFIIFLSILSLSCSVSQTSISIKNDYFPLAVGNKWLYNDNSSIQIVGIDSIEGKKYFKTKFQSTSTNKPPYIYYQRLSNDTLFTLNFNEKYGEYSERITAIFNLDSGEVAQIELPITNLTLSYEAEGLPTGRKYTIKAVNKSVNTIEFLTKTGGIDSKFYEVYKKGIGKIKSKNSWGVVLDLIDYDLN